MPEIEKTPVTEEPATESPAPTSVRSPAKMLSYILGLAALVLALDQLSKMWAQSALVVGDPPRPLIGELIQLRLIYNPGAALSIASGMTWVLTLLSVGVVVFIVLMARKIASTAWAIALGLVLGGAVGNLLDRLFRAPGFPNGHVVDFIDYGPFIGNVADIAIVVAAVLIAVLAFIGIGPDGKRPAEDAADDAASDVAATSDAAASTSDTATSDSATSDSTSSETSTPGASTTKPVTTDSTNPESSES